jgi:hypothetical protein
MGPFTVNSKLTSDNINLTVFVTQLQNDPRRTRREILNINLKSLSFKKN